MWVTCSFHNKNSVHWPQGSNTLEKLISLSLQRDNKQCCQLWKYSLLQNQLADLLKSYQGKQMKKIDIEFFSGTEILLQQHFCHSRQGYTHGGLYVLWPNLSQRNFLSGTFPKLFFCSKKQLLYTICIIYNVSPNSNMYKPFK